MEDVLFRGFNHFIPGGQHGILTGGGSRRLGLFVGVDLRFEFPRLNLIYRHLVRRGAVRLYSVGLRSLGMAKNHVRQIGVTSETLIQLFEGRHQWLNSVRKFDPTSFTVFWGRGFRDWLGSSASALLPCIMGWASLWCADMISLYSDVSDLCSWFVSNAVVRVGKFYRVREGFNLAINCSSLAGHCVNQVDSVTFASFEEQLPDKCRSALVLGVPTLFECESFVVDVSGVAKSTNVVVGVEVPRTGVVAQVRTVRRFLGLLSKFGFGGVGVDGSLLGRIVLYI